MKKYIKLLYCLLISMVLINCLLIRLDVTNIVKTIFFIIMIICAIGLSISVYDKRIKKRLRITMYTLVAMGVIIFTYAFINNIKGFSAFHFLLVIILVCAVNCFVIRKYASEYRKLNNKQ